MKLTRRLLWLAACLILAWATAELAYQRQWWNFYRTELKALNPADNLKTGKQPKVLVLGDSFTADTGSFVSLLQKQLPQYHFINSAIPGTGISEALCIAPGRIKQYKPTVIIYQVYTGNDLLDIRKPLNSNVSLSRKVFWWLTNQSLLLRYINYKAGQWKTRLGVNPIHSINRTQYEFDTALYSVREKLLIRADPFYIENTVLLKNGKETDLKKLAAGINILYDHAKAAEAQLIVAVIPHCAQVNTRYAEQTTQLGARYQHTGLLQQTNYPFIAQLQQHLADSSIQVVNLLPVFQQADTAGHHLYYNNDIHLTPQGQKTVAGYIIPLLQPR